jgi:competence protein ComFC
MNTTLLNLDGWIDAVLGLVYPNICQICEGERALPQEGYVCPRCWEGVRFVSPPYCQLCGLPYPGEITQVFECGNCKDLELSFDFARAAVIANPLLLEIIHRYKYNQALWFEAFLIDLLLRQAVPAIKEESWDWIVPVPLHSHKQRERGFNQAARMAQALSRATGIEVREKVLERAAPTRTQTLLSRKERVANVSDAFAFLPVEELKGERIVLVDDVLTTGSTTSACANILRTNGAGAICVWTVARGLLS